MFGFHHHCGLGEAFSPYVSFSFMENVLSICPIGLECAKVYRAGLMQGGAD